MVDAERALVRASAALAAGRQPELVVALRDAQAWAGQLATEEMLLQSYLFVGYPRTLQALALWRELSGLPSPEGRAEDEDLWEERGERVCARVYGGQYHRLRSNVARLHPDLERWMLHEGYGKVLGRPGLELRVRELCIVALLAVQDAPAQLYSHLRGALNADATFEDVTEVLDLAATVSDPALAAAARATWDDVRAREQQRGRESRG